MYRLSHGIALVALAVLALGHVANFTSNTMQFAYGSCIRDEDWPDKPCLDTPPYSDDYVKQFWQQYYELKGKDWMEMKKAVMYQAIANGTLREWVETRSSPNNFANYNVWKYFYLYGQAPNAYGPLPTKEQLQECQELGIRPEKCSDTELLKQECLGPSCNIESQPPIVFDAPLISLFIGVGSAVVAGVWLLTKRGKLNDGKK